jgi:hypothetical protein
MSFQGFLMGALLGRTGVTITAVDERDLAGSAGRLTHCIGSVPMRSVHSMVNNVLGALQDDIISRLNIIDHGNEKVLTIGDDYVSLATLQLYRPILGRLFGRFADDGFVHLQHCLIGQNPELLVQLADTFGVPVVAGRGLTYSVAWTNEASLVAAYPDGRVSNSFERWVGFFSDSKESSKAKQLKPGL